MPVVNPFTFIGEPVLGATAGAPLSVDANGNLVSGISNLEASATATTTTASATDVLMTSMQMVTPAAGTYLVWFSTTVDHSAQVTAITATIYQGATALAHSARPTLPRTNAIGAQTLSHELADQAKVVVNGAENIEVRWKTGGATATANARTMNALRIS